MIFKYLVVGDGAVRIASKPIVTNLAMGTRGQVLSLPFRAAIQSGPSTH
jgi:hypothetical protein